MKKLLTILLALLCTLSLVACSKEEPVVEKSAVELLVDEAATTFVDDCDAALADATAVNTYTGEILTELNEPVEITVWNTYYAAQQEAFQKIVDGFNELYKGKITVKYEVQSYTDYDTNLLNAVRAGTRPNITNRYCSTAAQYVQDELLVNLYPYITDASIGIEGFKENLVGKEYEEVTQWGDDALYVFPIIITTEVLYYNADLFKELNLEVPTTWTQLAEASKAIYEAKGIPGWGSDSETDTMIDRIIQLGSGYINGETCTSEVDVEKFKEVLTWYLNGLNDGYFRLAGADMYHSGPFTSGQVASYIGSSAGVSYVLPYADFEVGVTAIPQEGNETFCPAWGGGLVVFNGTAEENLASYLFLKYCMDDEVLANWSVAFGAMPATYSSINTATYQTWANENVVGKALVASSNYVNWVNSVPGADSFRNAFGYAVDNAAAELEDSKTAETAE